MSSENPKTPSQTPFQTAATPPPEQRITDVPEELLTTVNSEIQDTRTTLLLANDDDYSLKLTSLALEELGLTRLQIARDGRAGLRAMDGMPRPPELIICDVFMPNMDGVEFVIELAKRDFRGGVVLASGRGLDCDVLNAACEIAVASGLNVLGTLGKPFKQDALRQAIFGEFPPLKR